MKWLRKLLKGMSLTAALFVFQACYGTPAGYPDDFFDENVVEAVSDTDASLLPDAETPEAESGSIDEAE